MSTEVSDVERAEMMLTLGMNEEGNALSESEKADLEAFVASQQPAGASEQAPHALGATKPTTDPGEAPAGPQEYQTTVTPEALQAMIQQQIAQAQGVTGGPVDPETFLRGTDPKDSDTALMLLQWLIDTGRMQNIGTINGGGYLFHYQEPKGTTKAGYTPGATKGGRMVDQALDQAKESGAKPRKTGMCDQCWSAVEQQEDGTIVLDDDTKSSICSAGGKHTFNG
jgi:hypothetical protein